MRKEFEALCRRALAFFGMKNAIVRVFFVSGSELADMKLRSSGGNKRAPRRSKKEIDVLAFPEPRRFPHPEEKRRVLGEVYLNRALTLNDRRRASYLLGHGFLHLLGYRHGSRSDMIKMEKREQQLWDRIFWSV